MRFVYSIYKVTKLTERQRFGDLVASKTFEAKDAELVATVVASSKEDALSKSRLKGSFFVYETKKLSDDQTADDSISKTLVLVPR